jgi:hypothetical protein
MKTEELDALLNGAKGVKLTQQSGNVIWLMRHDLVSPVAWRAAMRRQLGHTGYEPPVYDQEAHDESVRELFELVRSSAR